MSVQFKMTIVLFFFIHSLFAASSILMLDPMGVVRPIYYEKKNGYAVTEGDILLNKLKNLQRPNAVIRLKVGGSRWPQGIVPFSLAENLPFKTKVHIWQALDHWQLSSHVQFVEITAMNRHFYRDYIIFTAVDGYSCASYVGRMGGQQEITLASRCTTMNIVHEIGHALGLWHEQSRFDRNNYITIAWENIDDEHKHNFDQPLTDGKDYGEYDYSSIMHYGPYAFSKNGQQTIIPIQIGVIIGQRERLSAKDIAAVNAMYPEA